MKLDPTEIRKLGLRDKNSQINEKTESFVKIYSNNVGFEATNWDTSLTFGEIIGLNENAEPVVEQKVKISMTREFMKALSNLLSLNIKVYEEKYGKISFENMIAVAEDIEKENKAKKVGAKKAPRPSAAKKS